MTGRRRRSSPEATLLVPGLPSAARAYACAGALAASITACGGAHNARAPAPAPPPAGSAGATNGVAGISATATPSAAAAPHGVEVVLLSAGENPKRALRYAFNTDVKEGVDLDVRTSQTATMDGERAARIAISSTRMNVLVEPLRITPQGGLVYRFDVASVDSQDDAAADPAVKDAVDQELNELVGISGEAEVSSRGQSLRARVRVPPDAGEQAREALKDLKQAIEALTVPLPEEPVGWGARWTTTTPLRMKTLDVTRTVTYTLSQLDAASGTLDFTIAFTAPSLRSRRLQHAHITFDSFNASGHGRIRFDLQRLASTMEVEMKLAAALSFEALDKSHTMGLDTQFAMHVAPAH